jgi:RimJ/RimL family protein N-acetyltransferase
MLTGKVINLRPVRERDIDVLWEKHIDIEDRGPFFPIGVMSAPRFRRQFNESGFWAEDDGMLVIVDKDDAIVGHIEFFQTVKYLDELELSYQIYGSANRGKGIASEAVRLMTRYLFERRKNNRIRLIIHPDNKASRRVAEKTGYQYEGIARGAWFNRGKNHDVAVYSALREEFLAETASQNG